MVGNTAGLQMKNNFNVINQFSKLCAFQKKRKQLLLVVFDIVFLKVIVKGTFMCLGHVNHTETFFFQ